MRKIVHLGKYYHPERGGIESVTRTLAIGAVNAGYMVYVICFHKSKLLKIDSIEGVNIIRSPFNRIISSQPISFSYLVQCFKICNSADIIHLHSPNLIAAFYCLFINRSTKLLVHWHSDILGKGFLSKFLRPFELLMLYRANCIIATSEIYLNASNSSIRYRFNEKAVSLPIGIPDNCLADHEIQLPKPIVDFIKDKRVILSVGRLVSYKGFEYLIRSANFQDDQNVILIVGNGPLLKSLSKTIEDLNLEKRVLLLGSVESDLLQSLFRIASLFCLSSIHRAEAFGVVLLEAMSYSLPIVATNIIGSGVPWVNVHESTGLNVPPKNSMAIAEACNKILSNPDLWLSYSQASRARFLNNFTEEIFVKKTISVYEHLLNKNDKSTLQTP